MSRTDFHEALKALLGSDSVYFQPPPSIMLKYPAVVYERSRLQQAYGDGCVYSVRPRYTVTLIYKDPDSPLPKKFAEYPQTRHERHFAKDNLYHDVYVMTP